MMARLDDTMALLSNPIGEPLTVPNLILFERAAEEADVVLNGEGGDPCFGGPKNATMLVRELYGLLGGTSDTLARERAYLRAHRKAYEDLPRLFVPRVADANDDRLERMIASALEDPRWSTFVNRLMALNVRFKGGHHILPKVEHLSRSAGILARSPLFDRQIVDLAQAMPAQFKLRGWTEKWILKRAVEDIVPAAVVRREKSGMRVPLGGWLTTGLLGSRRFRRFARERLLDGLEPYEIVQRPYVEALLDRHPTVPIKRTASKIWLLLSLEAWVRTVLAPIGGTPKLPG
jgi:asparagine synthase (glutamine-hydrolysing)